MATAQSVFFKILQLIDPKTKALSAFSQLANQVPYQDASAGVAITAATNTNPVTVTANNHGLQTNDPIFIAGSTGLTSINNSAAIPFWPATVVNGNQFTVPVAGDGAWAAGGTVTKALVGSVDGARFARQRQLEIYNLARRTLLRSMVDLWKNNTERVMNEIGASILTKNDLAFISTNAWQVGKLKTGAGSFTAATGYLVAVMSTVFDVTDVGKLVVFNDAVNNANIYAGTIKQFIAGNTVRIEGNIPAGNIASVGNAFVVGTSTSGDTAATLPDDYIEFVSLIDAASANSKKNSISLVDPKFLQDILRGYDPQYVQSASRRFVILRGTQLYNPAGYVQAGATYSLSYYGLADFALADILGNAVAESLPFGRHAALMELAQAIAEEKSVKEVNKLAVSLISKGE